MALSETPRDVDVIDANSRRDRCSRQTNRRRAVIATWCLPRVAASRCWPMCIDKAWSALGSRNSRGAGSQQNADGISAGRVSRGLRTVSSSLRLDGRPARHAARADNPGHRLVAAHGDDGARLSRSIPGERAICVSGRDAIPVRGISGGIVPRMGPRDDRLDSAHRRGTAQGLVWTFSRVGGAIGPFLYFGLFNLSGVWTTPLWILAGCRRGVGHCVLALVSQSAGRERSSQCRRTGVDCSRSPTADRRSRAHPLAGDCEMRERLGVVPDVRLRGFRGQLHHQPAARLFARCATTLSGRHHVDYGSAAGRWNFLVRAGGLSFRLDHAALGQPQMGKAIQRRVWTWLRGAGA